MNRLVRTAQDVEALVVGLARDLAQQSVRPGTPFRGYWRTTQYTNISQNGTTGTSTTNASGLIPAYIRQAPSGVITVSTGQTTLPLPVRVCPAARL